MNLDKFNRDVGPQIENAMAAVGLMAWLGLFVVLLALAGGYI